MIWAAVAAADAAAADDNDDDEEEEDEEDDDDDWLYIERGISPADLYCCCSAQAESVGGTRPLCSLIANKEQCRVKDTLSTILL